MFRSIQNNHNTHIYNAFRKANFMTRVATFPAKEAPHHPSASKIGAPAGTLADLFRPLYGSFLKNNTNTLITSQMAPLRIFCEKPEKPAKIARLQ